LLADLLQPVAMTTIDVRIPAEERAAIGALAAGEPVGKVARLVGHESASAFVAAFRRETGMTPAMYFRSVAGPSGD